MLGGCFFGDYNSHKTIYAGPDPADSNRVLIKKVIQTSDKTWAFEESRVTPSETEGANPTVHTTVTRIGILDMNDNISFEEETKRLIHRAMPNLLSFSLFSRAYQTGRSSSFSVVENSHTKASYYRWSEWWKDVQDRRDLSQYLWLRWLLN
mgnify:CR=1 FL=1